MKKLFLLTALIAALFPALDGYAEETRVTVRAMAVDAKFIGSGVGGMDVHIAAVDSGEVLAAGRIEGGTGDTALLMKTPHERGMQLSQGGAAAFKTALDLERPTRVRVTVKGPLDEPSAMQTLSKTVTLVPGGHVEGDGIVFNVPGLIVSAEASQAEEGSLAIEARVTMMCGCPLTAGGLWDAGEFTVEALAIRDGAVVDRQPLAFTGEPNTFAATFAPEPGYDGIVVTAYQAGTGNAGSDLVDGGARDY